MRLGPYLAAAALLLAVCARAEEPAQCHYAYSVWNVKAKASKAHRTVAKPYAQLTAKEKGPLGCTPCEEDQVAVKLPNGLELRACRLVADKIHDALEAALSRGQKIVSVVGYRAQMSKGPADKSGNRTELSNHAFGVAVDLNEDYNGLYNSCFSWSPKCVLGKGGKYRPGSELSLTEQSPAVQEMKKIGYDWGGKIEGRQKDFMHFSPTGY
ncbi:MAG: M15 family metallopeptidase [Elusimicrobia bacterium]|nr:M15 family metallopeptidase [Elusimicrobiota bacterium]